MRLIWYFAFLALAAPIELIVDWYRGLTLHNPVLWAKPLGEAMLYLYAFVLAVEAVFRVSPRSKFSSSPVQLHAITACSIIVFALFALDYLGEYRPLIEQGVPVDGIAGRQFIVLLAGLAASLMAFRLTDKGKKRSVKRKAIASGSGRG